MLELINSYKQEQEAYKQLLDKFNQLFIKEEYVPIIANTEKYLEITEQYLSYYQAKYDEIIKAEEEELWRQKALQYPVATQIWRELKQFNFNDYVCAGILGNIMAEVGGQTLNIQYEKYSSSAKGYYGICQWSKSYKDVWGLPISGQIDFLTSSIVYEFDTYGFKYRKGFNYDSFVKLTNEKEAALAFAKCYERCSKASYEQRQINATKAYNYFVNN